MIRDYAIPVLILGKWLSSFLVYRQPVGPCITERHSERFSLAGSSPKNTT